MDGVVARMPFGATEEMIQAMAIRYVPAAMLAADNRPALRAALRSAFASRGGDYDRAVPSSAEEETFLTNAVRRFAAHNSLASEPDLDAANAAFASACAPDRVARRLPPPAIAPSTRPQSDTRGRRAEQAQSDRQTRALATQRRRRTAPVGGGAKTLALW